MARIKIAMEKALWVVRENYIPRTPTAFLKHPNSAVTGNMKYNATKIDYLSDNVSKVFVDDNIAPYVPYTNEPWISPKWKGAKNPNENWFAKFVEEYAKQLAIELHGKLKIK